MSLNVKEVFDNLQFTRLRQLDDDLLSGDFFRSRVSITNHQYKFMN